MSMPDSHADGQVRRVNCGCEIRALRKASTALLLMPGVGKREKRGAQSQGGRVNPVESRSRRNIGIKDD